MGLWWRRLVVANKINWPAVKEDFIVSNLDPSRDELLTLKELAANHGVNYESVRRRAGKEGWNDEVKKRAEKLAEESIEVAQEQFSQSEAEIRERQIKIARLAQAKAVVRLQDLKPSELTVREAIELLKLGLPEERKAAGMPDKVDITVPVGAVLGTFLYVEVNERVLNLVKEVEKHAEIEFSPRR